MAELHWTNNSLEIEVGQTQQISLAGEESTAPLSPDQTFTVPANLNGLISYNGAYKNVLEDSVLVIKYPNVTVNFETVAAASETLLGQWKDKTIDQLPALSGPDNEGKDTLSKLFKILPWTYPSPVFGTNVPFEAVTKTENLDITCPQLSSILTQTISNTSDSHEVRLFEAALAAGKFSKSTLDGSDDGVGAAEFVANDTFSVYVTYKLKKTRKFVLDLSQNGGTTRIVVPGAKLNGDDLVLDSVTTDVSQESEVISHIVQWKFVHTPPSS